MTNILEKIIEEKKQSLILTKKEKSFDVLEKNIKVQNFFNFKETIQNNKGISLISEIKKASPSAGILIYDFNHLDIAKKYINNGLKFRYIDMINYVDSNYSVKKFLLFL